MTPLSIAFLVGLIGIFGIFSALHAVSSIIKEANSLDRGRRLLEDLPADLPIDYDYRSWIIEQDAGLSDTHFGDHLFSAALAAKSGRAVTLHEFHQLSNRREDRRKDARLSGGITALLLVCGIAGTLLAIKPILGDFSVTSDPAGISNAADNVAKATDLIQSLGEAFLPSLVALGLTVFVAFARGFYTQLRGHLAGKLDEFDLQDLFHRFPPPSISNEMNNVRAQLTDLVTQILASQRNLDGFVQQLTNAASVFQGETPKLQKVSKEILGAVNKLTPAITSLDNSISQNFGQSSPLITNLNGIAAISSDVVNATKELKSAGSSISKSIDLTSRMLKQSADLIESQIQSAGVKTTENIANAAGGILETLFNDAVLKINNSASPLITSSSIIVKEVQSLKADTKQTVDDLSKVISSVVSSTTSTLHQSLLESSTNLASNVNESIARIEKANNSSVSKIEADINSMKLAIGNELSQMQQTCVLGRYFGKRSK